MRLGGAALLHATTLLCALLLGTPELAAQDDPNAYCTGDPCVISGDIEVADGSDVDFEDRVVTVTGILSVQDGSMTIRAAELNVVDQGQLNGSRGAGGGSFEILTTGDIRIDGERPNGAVRLVGEDGGFLTLESDFGSILGDGDIIVNSTTALGDAGVLDLSAGANINLTGLIEGVSGLEAFGGELDASAEGDISLTGGINFTGGEDGGGAIFIVGFGSLTLGAVTLDGRSEFGDGGSIDAAADGSIELLGAIQARGSNSSVELCGDGGDLCFEAGQGLTTRAAIDVNARRGDCLAGSVELTGATVLLEGPLSIRGEGTQGSGGTLTVNAIDRIDCTGDIDGVGNDDGGIVEFLVESLTPLSGQTTIDCDIDLSGPFGDLDVDTNTDVTVRGTIVAGTTGSGTPGSGGFISIEGCNVTVEQQASLASRGAGAINVITARDEMLVSGTMTAEVENELLFRPGVVPSISGLVTPAPTLTQDASLRSCDPSIPTVTPTPIPNTPTSTPTTTPTRRLVCVGDCNEDGFVTVDELVLVANIGLGRAPLAMCPAADGNRGGTIDINEVVTAVSNSINDCGIVGEVRSGGSD